MYFWCSTYNNDKIFNTCKTEYYFLVMIINVINMYMDVITVIMVKHVTFVMFFLYLRCNNKYIYECSTCNNDGTWKICNDWYYKGNDNNCYECIIDRCSKYNSDRICNTCKSRIL